MSWRCWFGPLAGPETHRFLAGALYAYQFLDDFVLLYPGAIMQGSRGGVDLPKDDVDRVKSHLAKYYKKMDETAPWERS